MRWLLFLLPAICVAYPCPHPVRDSRQRTAFVKLHPCPATGIRSTKCPGYVIDHIIPLCACGLDRPSNMQWQTIAEAKRKDVSERRLCRTTAAR